MKRRVLFILLILAAVSLAAEKQPATPAGINLQQPLPVDPNVVIGKLPNGMRYWIRQHKTPPGKIGIWLHVGSGSLNEEENQRGLAHFLEHMAFNGSEHYPPGTLIRYYESIGLRFGQHQNAFTSFDQTTYVLSLPDTKEETIRKGLETLADFAFRMSLLPDEINKERNVILEEARARKGVGQRINEKALPILLPGSRFAQRLPIELVQVGGRQQDHGNRARGRIRREAIEHLRALQIGHGEIKDDDVGARPPGLGQPLLAVDRLDDIEPRHRQVLGVELPQVLLIFGDQHDRPLALFARPEVDRVGHPGIIPRKSVDGRPPARRRAEGRRRV